MLQEVEIAKSYFTENYVGTCIEVGASNGLGSSITYEFENAGWKCLCVEPNPVLYEVCAFHRNNVLNLAVGAVDEDDVNFHVYNVGGSAHPAYPGRIPGNQEAISGLSTDSRLVDSHKHLIVDQYDIKVNVRTLDTIIKEHFTDVESIDFITIDTEGTELDVLKGFDLNKWLPKLLVIENNFNEPFLEEYLVPFGYVKENRHGVNDFYVFRGNT